MRNLFFFIFLLHFGCQPNNSPLSENQRPENTLFQALSPQVTNIHFTNQVVDDKEFNIFNYRNFYNGGGVALGDGNNDGLRDIILFVNKQENKL